MQKIKPVIEMLEDQFVLKSVIRKATCSSWLLTDRKVQQDEDTDNSRPTSSKNKPLYKSKSTKLKLENNIEAL
jgi:hypothetical protein